MKMVCLSRCALLIAFCVSGCINQLAAQTFSLSSPDKHLSVGITLGHEISYFVLYDADTIVRPSTLQMVTSKGTLGSEPRLLSKKLSANNDILKPVVPLKNASIADVYNSLELKMKGNYAVEFRAYNDGLAYRFLTSLGETIEVINEVAEVQLGEGDSAWLSPTPSFKCDYQILYQYKPLSGMDAQSMNTLPLLINQKSAYKVLFSEADLFDYPCMFLKSKGGSVLQATFPKVPLAFGDEGDRSVKIEKEAGYIAKTKGNRSFPWRFFVITHKDEDILANEMVYKLSRPLASTDTAWIQPGHVTWEWWHNAHVYGVDFKSGYNMDTYKYYIDFASAYNIPYIIMDEGWAKSTMDPFHPNPSIDLFQLIEYGKQKHVKIMLWFTWLCVENNFDAIFKTLHDWGIAGMKIDFMDRSDQWMVNYYTRVAKAASENHLLVDFHGAFKPAGLRRAYPNVLSYEGVVGMEGNILGGVAKPDNNVLLPFIRNAVGPMDYTPGALHTAQPEDYRGDWVNAMSIGTRGHQLSMYVVFESGLQMLADNPVNYYKEPELTKFIADCPVVWDETKVLDAKVGEYIVLARRKAGRWYIGAMTNSRERTLTIKADFLTDASSHQMQVIQDGVNADVQAMDYKILKASISKDSTLTIHMARNGGYVAVIQ